MATDSLQQQDSSAASGSGRHILDCGKSLELISLAAKGRPSDRPPLLFLHGALHGAWCYAENFLPYFSKHGYDAHAVSLRGHGRSDPVSGQSCSFSDHMDDLSSVIQSLPRPPVLVAHSLGGILAQRYLLELAEGRDRPKVAGVAFLASPAISAALGPSFQWFQQLRGVRHGLQVIWWMSAMPKERQSLVRSLFFSSDLPEDAFQRYHAHLRSQPSVLPVTAKELKAFEAKLAEAVEGGRQWSVPTLVMQASEDRLIMPCQVEALSRFLGVAPVLVPAVAHDVMLVSSPSCSSGICSGYPGSPSLRDGGPSSQEPA